ncbi:MAG: hypothetical protein WC835_03165 [Candidatus Paceibacterota bacterium]|jgi:hypothetical protein
MNLNCPTKAFIFFTLVIGAFLPIFGANIMAQSAGDLVAERRTKLEGDLKILESQIEAQQQIIDAKRRDTVSLERDISIFDANIKKANLSIKARDISIKQLTNSIADKKQTIGVLSGKLSRELESLAQLIRKTDQIENVPLQEFVLGNGTISDVFADVDRFRTLEDALNKSRDIVSRNKADTEDEKKALEDRKTEESQLRSIQMLEKQRLEQDKKAKAKLLATTKGQEAEYQKILKARQKDAAAIRSELFALQGSKSISFGKAFEYATEVLNKLGIRPAFLLGIITEESNLGENVGTGNWRTDMHPTRDQPVFATIVAELGLDPDKMPVSKKPWYGWGGAMGPAQFIPSTWILYKDRIADLTGHNPPNPWDPYDAFMASGILLKDNGGAGGNAAKERLAALRYLAGWTNATKKAYAFYGDDVMALAAKYQQQIDILQNSQ